MGALSYFMSPGRATHRGEFMFWIVYAIAHSLFRAIFAEINRLYRVDAWQLTFVHAKTHTGPTTLAYCTAQRLKLASASS